MSRRKFEAPQGQAQEIPSDGQLTPGVFNHKLFFASRIRDLRQEAGLSQANLGSILGVSSSAVKNWESGRTRPDLANIPFLCKALHVSVSDLFTSDTSEKANSQEEQELLTSFRGMGDPHRHILIRLAHDFEEMDRGTIRPVIPFIRLRRLIEAEEAVAAGIGDEGYGGSCTDRYVHDVPDIRNADILFHVNGESMQPDYPNGCTVLVKKVPELSLGDIGIFDVDGVLFIKKFQKDGLYSLNPEYKPMLARNYGEIRTIGRVLGIMDEEDYASDEEIAAFKAQK
ncbi:MAG: helix-turn-helix domain-containing protein [Clostridia bacterium]|nr:helix-turn-helix domain-containing protein [Clostridia bacterium]